MLTLAIAATAKSEKGH